MKQAFTLVEIIIVVAIVVILITLTAPAILRSRVVANEAMALANLKTINNACQSYHINNRTYPGSLSNLANSNPPYIDSLLGGGNKQGYEFIYSLIDPDHFTVNANPTTTGLLKGRYFYMDESGVIRVNSTGPAGPNDEVAS